MSNNIVSVSNVSSAGGFFTVQGTNSAGATVTVQLSFQEYMLLFTRLNTEGADVAVASMLDNSNFFMTVLQDISNATKYVNSWLALYPESKPDDKYQFPASETSGQPWYHLYDTYPFAQPLLDYVRSGKLEYRKVRSLLDNLNECQITFSSQNDQWNTRTGNLVNSRGTAIELAKSILSAAKDALSSTVIR